MTQGEEQLLLKDLCARLPYGLLVRATYKDGEGWKTEDRKLLGVYSDGQVYLDSVYTEVEKIKPYLRPMSSMTEDEKNKLKEYLDAEEVDCAGFGYIEGGTLEDYVSSIPYTLCSYVINWLNVNHFDYGGLIPKDLALEAPKGMYD